jgi:acetyl-CoA carboxylase carboxyl transferase subunit beta
MSKKPSSKKPGGMQPSQAGLTPSQPGASSGFGKQPKVSPAKTKKHEIPEGLWSRCPQCGRSLFRKVLEENLRVCNHCQHHFHMGARERIHALVATCSFEELDAELTSVDILRFTDVAAYPGRLRKHQKATGLKDAVVTGTGKIGGHRVALGVMDFSFLGGSMGWVVGEKLTRLIERATKKGLPLVIISASGGARMQEGGFSLMQMAKISGVLHFHAKANLPYISVLTSPTTGGVLASFASVGDLVLAEPGAKIGFTGPRVIEDAAQTRLPAGFQTAEFLAERVLIDAIVPRKELKQELSKYLGYLGRSRALVEVEQSPCWNGSWPPSVKFA